MMTYLVLDTAGLHLVSEDLGTGLLGLSLVNVLHKNTLVLEDVTLRLLVERVVATGAQSARVRGGYRMRRKQSKTHRCLSIFPASLYFLNNRRKTRCLLIHWTFVGIRASAVPFLLPGPV